MKRKKSISLEQGLYIAGIVILAAGLPLLLFYLSLPEETFSACVLYDIFGIYCPGCGGSRAVRALLSGDIGTALYYHPFVPYAAVLFFVFMLSHTLHLCSGGRLKGLRFHSWFLYSALFIIILNFMIKNILKFCFGIVAF